MWGVALRSFVTVLNATGLATMAFQLGNYFDDDPSDEQVADYVNSNPEKVKYALQQPTLTKFGIIMIPMILIALGYFIWQFKRKR